MTPREQELRDLIERCAALAKCEPSDALRKTLFHDPYDGPPSDDYKYWRPSPHHLLALQSPIDRCIRSDTHADYGLAYHNQAFARI